MTKVLIVFDTRGGATLRLAERIAEGVKSVADAEVVFRRVAIPGQAAFGTGPKGAALHTQVSAIRELGMDDLAEADAIVTGCPSHFGSMTSGLQAMWERTRQLWDIGALVGKPGAVFTTAATPHGGSDMTLLSLITSMIHHGMLIVAPGYAHPSIRPLASPFGLVAYTSPDYDHDDHTLKLAMSLGRRVADVARRLSGKEVVLETR